jgi:hypothetical protein
MKKSRKILSFDEYLKNLSEDQENSNLHFMTSEEIANYIEQCTPDETDIPHYFIEQALQSKKKFYLKDVIIEDLLDKDESLNDYVNSDQDRYNEDDNLPYDSAYTPIVILDDQVLDGYSRIKELIKRKETKASAYVA